MSSSRQQARTGNGVGGLTPITRRAKSLQRSRPFLHMPRTWLIGSPPSLSTSGLSIDQVFAADVLGLPPFLNCRWLRIASAHCTAWKRKGRQVWIRIQSAACSKSQVLMSWHKVPEYCLEVHSGTCIHATFVLKLCRCPAKEVDAQKRAFVI